MTNDIQPRDDEVPDRQHVDVVVVGARCAGATTAMLLAAAGHDVLVVDRAAPSTDTLSTHALARTGMVQLHRWGLLPAVMASGAPAIHQVEFHTATGTVTRTIKDRHGVDHLLAPRRFVLDGILQDAARGAGARVHHGITVHGVTTDGDGRATGVRATDEDGRPIVVTARFVIGADGLRSRVARSVGAEMLDVRPSSGSTHYAYFAGDWPAMEYHLGDGAFAGVFPTHGGEACIWVCSPDDWAIARRRRGEDLESAFDLMVADAAPELARRLDRCVRTSHVRGMVRTPNHVRRAVGPGWALVGDAGYHRDAITGHGISDAFRDAELLSTAIDQVVRARVPEADALSRYQHERDEMLRDVFDLTCALAEFPPPDRFAELQKQLGDAIDAQSALLAGRPVPVIALAAV